ncbi:Tim44 domain-containing protein [Variovorax sp. OV329]|uniref:Tim44 domain-containing protein n=1 Tax=Variovorax sp. OV329 TaxID=1882825 RepID=UPI0008E35541|nr:Tim44-like domain-containing protein [Variovorax sp. OV329]SFM07177.1 Predicted lipid-binding transport protein, Tim44 family [Variovorax sp. OV329]
MKKFLPVLFACVIALVSMQADAARMGGGKSMGRQSNNVTQREAAPSAPANNAAPAQSANPSAAKPAGAAPAAAAPKRPWGAMLGGLAAGLGLAWLANSLGFGAAFGNFLLILLVGVAALVAWRMFAASRNKGPATRQGGYAFQGAGGPASATAPAQYSPNNVGNDASARPWERQGAAFEASTPAQHGSAALSGGTMIGSALSGSQSWGIPAGFDVDGFLAAAKRNFVTLQDAWDKSDISSLRSMMTDSMVNEIRTQLAERESHMGGAPNKTEVVMLDAKLLGIEELPDVYMASVEFSGMIREDVSAGPSPFREVWNMTKPVNGASGWLVAGVQALQ